jgi:hypothetical protein
MLSSALMVYMNRSFFPISFGNYLRLPFRSASLLSQAPASLRVASAAISAPFIDTFYPVTRSNRTSFSQYSSPSPFIFGQFHRELVFVPTTWRHRERINLDSLWPFAYILNDETFSFGV